VIGDFHEPQGDTVGVIERRSIAPDSVASIAEPIPVRGLFETHLTVRDVPRSVAFYRDVVGLPIALELPARDAAFLWIGAPGRAMLGLWGIGSSVNSMSLHIAFDVALDDVLAAPARLAARGVTPLSFGGQETAEPDVLAWMPAAAVYFRDPDGHLLEYIAMLEADQRPDAGVIPWSQWGG
jgi:lactoylglutathione lyase